MIMNFLIFVPLYRIHIYNLNFNIYNINKIIIYCIKVIYDALFVYILHKIILIFIVLIFSRHPVNHLLINHFYNKYLNIRNIY
ncbi:hypothetical membrane associated protein [Picrophilus oshimae DSM 9789]|uniref:Hypothetical membrane associated protein n=1 Tax=Picrophilus torridus (strain ATCC 700027 / DSM 9790 / JCM 10055 / NBRC 100828 / KAW 2/3) TaxID=1122961 RepID=Q6KZA9_PICTO|nr:hypothetical membrane associated protein [Picrophilus oshimae DSM 9789]